MFEELFKKRPKVGETVVKFVGEGCQGIDKFHWVGKVIEKRFNKEKNWSELVIQIIKEDLTYGDARDSSKDKYDTIPLVNNDLQNVKGVWILFN